MTANVEPGNDGGRDPIALRLQSLLAAIGGGAARGPTPVERWTPPFCGDIDMRIASDGSWHYAGSPIARPALVALFASILRKDPDRYVLVTPAECVGITVEDAPFVAVAMEAAEGVLHFATNLGDAVAAGPDHPLRFALDRSGGVKPYVHVRGGLFARLTRSLAHDLLDRVSLRLEDGEERYGIESGGCFFPIDTALAAGHAP